MNLLLHVSLCVYMLTRGSKGLNVVEREREAAGTHRLFSLNQQLMKLMMF